MTQTQTGTESRHMEVARNIQAQIARGLFMIGASNLLAVDEPLPGLQFKIMKNAKKVTHVRIELAADDTYTVSFHKVTRGSWETQELARVEMVYVDALAKTIEAHTGLYLSL
jgi:hypothetical protein